MDRLKNLFSQLKDLVLQGWAIFQDNRMSVYSGYATLFIVTAIFPCIILIISIVNLLPGYSTEDVMAVLFQVLPDLGPIKDLVSSLMTDLKDQSGGLLASAAAVTTLWSASKGVSSIQKGLNELDTEELEIEAAKIEAKARKLELKAQKKEAKAREKRGKEKKKERDDSKLLASGWTLAKGILKRLLFTLMLIILIPALLVFEMLGNSIAGIICSAIQKVNPDVQDSTLSTIDSVFNISSLVVILLALLVILLIFARLPLKRRTLKSQLPGAILTGVCWFLFTELFSFFIPRFYHASNLYGSLASLFLLLLWLRFVVMILFAGGALNHALEERRQDKEETSAVD